MHLHSWFSNVNSFFKNNSNANKIKNNNDVKLQNFKSLVCKIYYLLRAMLIISEYRCQVL